ncbi:MAG: hypothetical protein WBG37_17575 [Desulfobacterales bacterium]
MTQDPFGNLMDWGPVLDTLEELAHQGNLDKYQSGLIRILRFKGNWRLREEVLKRVGEIQSPAPELIRQVLTLLDDDNLYYDARILAGEALVQLLENLHSDPEGEIHARVGNFIKRLTGMPQPPFFTDALNRMNAALAQSGIAVIAA